MFELTKSTPYATWPELMQRFWDREPALRTMAASFQPAVEISESESVYKVAAECPGMKKEDFSVTLEGSTLTVSGEKREFTETNDEKEGFYHSERRFGRFSRSFTLPVKVEAAKIAAAYQDGVLEVTLPKVPEAQPQKIAVSDK